MNIEELIVSDSLWIFEELGSVIVYHKRSGEELTFKAIVDKNGQATLAYGYDKPLSQLHHEFTFLMSNLPNYHPVRGDTITFNEQSHLINFVAPNDSEIWLVAAAS